MSQNVWATIMPFGLVTLIFYWPKKNFRAGQRRPSFQALMVVLIFLNIYTIIRKSSANNLSSEDADLGWLFSLGQV
jgi:hypothetical protein